MLSNRGFGFEIQLQDDVARLRQIGPADGAGQQDPADPVVNGDPVRKGSVEGYRAQGLVRGAIADDHHGGAHAGKIPVPRLLRERDILANLAVRHFDHLQVQRRNVEYPQLGTPERGDVRLRVVGAVEDVMRHQVRRQGDVLDDLAEIGRGHVEFHHGEALLPLGRAGFALVGHDGKKFGEGRRRAEEAAQQGER